MVTNPMRQNKMLNAEQAHELGLVDRVIELERLIDEAITIALEQPARDRPISRRLASSSRARGGSSTTLCTERRPRRTGRST